MIRIDIIVLDKMLNDQYDIHKAIFLPWKVPMAPFLANLSS